MKCPIHNVEYCEYLWCPMCLIDEAEQEEERQEEERAYDKHDTQ